MHVYLNDELLSAEEAKVPVLDRGFAYGDSLFETIKVSGGRPVFLEEHLKRLEQGMATAGFGGTAPGAAEVSAQTKTLAQKNGVTLGRLRILVTRGTPPPGHGGPDDLEGLQPTTLLTVDPFAGAPALLYEKGAACITLRQDRGRFARLKAASLMDSILSRREVRAAGAWEGLFTDGTGRILEGIYTNIFFLEEKTLLTAPENFHILPGVVRSKVIEAAPQLGLSLEYRALTTGGLERQAESALLTSSLLGICPVSEIDGIQLRVEEEAIRALRRRLSEMEAESAAR